MCASHHGQHAGNLFFVELALDFRLVENIEDGVLCRTAGVAVVRHQVAQIHIDPCLINKILGSAAFARAPAKLQEERRKKPVNNEKMNKGK